MLSVTELRQHESASRIGEFASLCRCLMIGKGNPRNALNASTGYIPPRVVEILKATVPPMGSYGSGSGLEQLDGTRLILAAFSDALKHTSAWAAAVNASLIWRVPLGESVGLVAASAGTAPIVGPGDAAPVHKLAVSNANVERQKAVGLIVLSDELLRQSPGEAESIITRELRAAVGAGVDVQVMSTLTSGLTVHTSSGSPISDARMLMLDVTPTPASRPFWVLGTDAAIRVATTHTDNQLAAPGLDVARGGTFMSWPAFVSVGLSPTLMLLCDGARLAGNLADAEVSLSRQAVVAMEDGPPAGGMSGSPATLTGLATTNLVSLYQENLTGLLARQFFGAARLANNAVSAVSLAGSP